MYGASYASGPETEQLPTRLTGRTVSVGMSEEEAGRKAKEHRRCEELNIFIDQI